MRHAGVALLLALLAGCTGNTPSQTIDITGNSGPVTVNVPTSSSIVNTAPCGVQNPNNSKAVKPANGAQNCPTDNSSGHNSDESDETGG